MALATLSTACSSAGNEAAASIAGVRYSVDDLEAYLATTNPENDGTAELSTATSWLQRWAFFVGIELELEEEGVSVTDGDEADAILQLTVTDPDFDPDGPGSDIVIRQTAIISLAEEWATTEVAEIEPTEVDDVGIPGYLCSSHILVGTPEEALDVLARIDAGEPFADLAAELSLDPGSGQLGGDLGCVSEGTFVAEFEAAAYGGTAGEFVQAVSQFGIHVIEIHSVGPRHLRVPSRHPGRSARGCGRAGAAER